MQNVFRTPVREIPVDDQPLSTPRRSSRIRKKSGGQSDSAQSDSDSESTAKSRTVARGPALIPVEEDKEIVFSPPRKKGNPEKEPTTISEVESPNFS